VYKSLKSVVLFVRHVFNVQMESTLLVLTKGEAGLDCCDPFVDALKKRSTAHKYGPHIIICDLLVIALRDGSLLSY